MLATAFVAVLGYGVLGSDEISWSSEAATTSPGEISWNIEAAAGPGEISWGPAPTAAGA
ncbi:hypothetical protein [Streptomyces sp. NPDC002994]|uniref:hypothetical protein n=1 Tax=Streptomyces sp. NPDC002994 TaxID=3154441 RepID=UPI0033AA3E3D